MFIHFFEFLLQSVYCWPKHLKFAVNYKVTADLENNNDLPLLTPPPFSYPTGETQEGVCLWGEPAEHGDSQTPALVMFVLTAMKLGSNCS